MYFQFWVRACLSQWLHLIHLFISCCASSIKNYVFSGYNHIISSGLCSELIFNIGILGLTDNWLARFYPCIRIWFLWVSPTQKFIYLLLTFDTIWTNVSHKYFTSFIVSVFYVLGFCLSFTVIASHSSLNIMLCIIIWYFMISLIIYFIILFL